MDQHDKTNPPTAPIPPQNPCTPNFNPSDPLQQELSSILRGFKKDPTSCISLGKDGVLRNLNGDRDVLDAIGLSPEFIAAFLDRLPPAYREGFDGADGSKVPREMWFSPDKGLLPRPLTEEQKGVIEAGEGENGRRWREYVEKEG